MVGEVYDWLFLRAKRDPLATFLDWFIENVSENNMLTEEELSEFEALEARGEAMSATQLQEMEVALSVVPSLPGASQHAVGEPLPLPEELSALEEELELLTMRRNMMNAHKIELREETYQLSQRAQRGRAELRHQVEAAASASHHLSKAQQCLARVMDQHLSTYHKFGEATEDEAVFFAQMDLEEWFREEDKFTDLLTTYIQRQFKAGVGVVAGTEDSSQYVLLDLNKMDLSLVRGAGEEQYCRNLAELHRLNALLPRTEEWRLCGLIQQARRKAEVEEAERLLAALHRGHLPSDMAIIRQQTEDAQECLGMVSKEFQQQRRAMQGVLAEVAQLEGTRTISGDYELKLQRQEYFIAKQKNVMDELVSQVARHNWVIIALQTEGERVNNMLQVLRVVNSRMTERDADYKDRMVQLETILKESEEVRASGSLPRPLHTLSLLLVGPPGQDRARAVGGEGAKELLLRQVEGLLSALTVAQDQVATTISPQFSSLTQKLGICEVLEARLFGSAGNLQALPLAWLDVALATRCTTAEQRAWEFKKKLIDIISQYEKKKKVLQIDPTMNQDFKKWTTDILRKVN